MTSLQIAVTLVGIATMVWVNWYFFLAGERAVAASGAGSGPQSIRIVVDGGYSPSVVTVEAGRPVRLEFERRESSGCTEEVVVPDFGIRTFLPAHQVMPVTGMVHCSSEVCAVPIRPALPLAPGRRAGRGPCPCRR